MSVSRFACVLGLVAMLAACQTTDRGQKETIGTVLGGVAGAVIGAQFGKGKGNTVGIAAGTLLGAWLGNSLGKSLDEADRVMLERETQNTLERQPTGQSSSWSNPDSGNSGTITPTKTYYEDNSSEPCREYSSTVTIDGQLETITGTACRQPDGTWRTVD